MDDTTHALIRRMAEQVHASCIRVRGDTKGSCREAAVALALALAKIHLPVVICSGTVRAPDGEREHAWCRIDGWIVDATADQFDLPAPLIGRESDLAEYSEDYQFIFHPAAVLAMMQSSATA